MPTLPLMRRKLVFSAFAGLILCQACSSQIPRRSEGLADAGVVDAAAEVSDADIEQPPEESLQITPGQGYLVIGESIQLGASLLDGQGTEINPEFPIEWSVSDSSLALVNESGLLTALGDGNVELKAQVGETSASVRIDVFGNLQACCALSMAQSLTNFCSVSPATAACSMTLAGGACDPDADGDYDEMSSQALSDMEEFFAGHCSEDVCVIDVVPNVATDCSADYDPVNRHWRCVELTTDFPGTLVSQVCTDSGSGPRWLTYNLTPLDCCACELETSTVGNAPDACVCTGGGCF